LINNFIDFLRKVVDNQSYINREPVRFVSAHPVSSRSATFTGMSWRCFAEASLKRRTIWVKAKMS